MIGRSGFLLPGFLGALAFLFFVYGFSVESSGRWQQQRRDNWAVLLCTSRYYYNYRHYVNALSMYKVLKDGGFRDDRIIFLNTEDEVTCDARNPYPGFVLSDLLPSTEELQKTYGSMDSGFQSHVFFNTSVTSDEKHSCGGPYRVEVDYVGDEVSVDAFLRLFDGRVNSWTELSKRLESTSMSNVFVYMTGHGGDEFFKFHDTRELTARDLAAAITEMYEKERFREMLMMIDTCQAATMCNHIDVPGVYCIGGSRIGENSYAYEPKRKLGLPVTDRFTLHVTRYLQREVVKNLSSNSNSKTKKSITDLMHSMDTKFLYSTPLLMEPIAGSRHPDHVALADFFTPAIQEYKDTPWSGSSICSEYNVNSTTRTCHSYDFSEFYEEGKSIESTSINIYNSNS